MDAKRLETCRRRLRSATPVVGPWLRRAAAQALAADNSAAAATLLGEALVTHSDSTVRGISAEALRRLQKPEAIDAACAVWEETRAEVLTALLRQKQWLATTPLELRVLTALKTGRQNLLAELGPAAIQTAVRACADADVEIATRARAFLGELRPTEQIEAFCDWLIHNEESGLRKLAIEKGYAPHDPSQRALFYFLTGQTERYEALDFDRGLLRAHYEVADDDLRLAIAARVRASGRPELAAVIQGGRERRTLSALNDREWEAIVSVLMENRRLDDLWAVVFDAPPECSAEALGFLKQNGYRPEGDAARVMFDRLCRLRPAEGRHLRLYLPVPICRTILKAHEHGVRTLAFARDGKTLATGSNDTSTLLWELPAGRVKARLAGQAGPVLALAFSPDGKSLVVGRGDHTARLWDVPARKLKGTFQGHTDRVTAAAFSPDGQTVGTGSNDNSVRLWDVASKECRAVLQGHSRGVMALAFSPDGKMVASGSHDETVILWYALSGHRKAALSGHSSSIFTLAFTPDGRTLATGSSDGTVRLWNLADGELRGVLEGHKGTVMTLAFSPDGKKLATGSLDKTVRLWDWATGQSKTTLHGHTDEINALAFSPDGKMLATGSRDSTARIWELASLKSLVAMTREDLEQVQKWAEVLPNPEEAKAWHFVAALLRHRFRFDIELSEVAERVLGEFDIEIDARVSDA